MPSEQKIVTDTTAMNQNQLTLLAKQKLERL